MNDNTKWIALGMVGSVATPVLITIGWAVFWADFSGPGILPPAGTIVFPLGAGVMWGITIGAAGWFDREDAAVYSIAIMFMLIVTAYAIPFLVVPVTAPDALSAGIPLLIVGTIVGAVLEDPNTFKINA
jgi:hypothetical protein